jgi:hypothetical protein
MVYNTFDQAAVGILGSNENVALFKSCFNSEVLPAGVNTQELITKICKLILILLKNKHFLTDPTAGIPQGARDFHEQLGVIQDRLRARFSEQKYGDLKLLEAGFEA